MYRQLIVIFTLIICGLSSANGSQLARSAKSASFPVQVQVTIQTNYEGNYEKGVAALSSGDHDAALKEFAALAEQGLARGQYALGWLYQKGYGVPKNDRIARELYLQSAEQGYARAQFSLGMIYVSGAGVAKDITKGKPWISKAAEQGFAAAQFQLGFMYENGHGVSQDSKTAVKWYALAANQGLAAAQYRLAEKYYYGRGLVKNRLISETWYERAFDGYNREARLGDSQSQYMLGRLYLADWVKQDSRLAQLWLEVSALQNNGAARIALILFNSGLVKQDLSPVQLGAIKAQAVRCLATHYQEC